MHKFDLLRAKIIVSVLFIFFAFNAHSQNNFWANANKSEFQSPPKERISNPRDFRTLTLDTEAFLDFSDQAKFRFDPNNTSSLIIKLPLPNGKNESFTLDKTALMHPDLAAKFPELKTFVGKGIDDPTASVRITYSPYFGLSGMIMSGKHTTVYIDPITKDNNHYMSFYRKDVDRVDEGFVCSTDESEHLERLVGSPSSRVAALGDCNLRRYRLAQSCTGEYAQYHIGQAGGSTGSNAGDKAIVQAAMNVTMNRVNGVFENDMGVTMQFVANNDLLIYLDGGTDPWTNEWNTQTAQTIDAQIGVASYDIGHNFNDTGGGNAGCLDCVCLSANQTGTHKGRGYTGRAAPIGDPFDIDYVAHEMGHQFGGYHTQSNADCRSGSGATEVETGSGSSIMGYAGICPANVQNQSDDYFAYVNIRDVVTTINGGNGSGCAEVIISGNSGPEAEAGSDYSIPVSTPFKLEGVGSDPDDAGITYCWEQNDPENPNSNATPVSTRNVGPMFRTFAPVAVPYRYMPRMSEIINNSTPTWEVLPSISRNMEFSFIVRDNNSASGCTASDLMSVTTVAGTGPFLVSSPNTAVSWDVGTTEAVTWDVAGTSAAPINCANVDILMSTDGGLTYPITLASSVPNDGTHDVTVPNNPGTNTRVMVFCSDNIFFDISNTDFTIQATVPTFLMATANNSVDVCSPVAGTYTIDLTSVSGFSDPVALTTTGVPAGASASFGTNPATPTASSVLSIDPGTAATGSYMIQVTGVGGGITRTLDLTYTIYPGTLSSIVLSAPSDGMIDADVVPSLSWVLDAGAVSYDIEVATDAGFSSIVYTTSGVTANNTIATGLTISTLYYWRVRGVNGCVNGDWSSVWSFTTQAISPCLSYASGPYTDFKNAPCASTCGTPIVLGFEVYGNESYTVGNVAAGAEYTFDYCNGYSAATWSGNITIAYYDGTSPTTHITTVAGCTATFTTPTDGDIIIIIWTDPCGSAEVAVDNGIPSFMCTGNGIVPDCVTCLTEDFEDGEPSSWYFRNAWTFNTGCIGTGTTGCNNGTDNWGYFDDDAAGNGSVDIAEATTPYINLADACNVNMSFDYTYREYNNNPQEFVQFRVFDGTQWQYWDGTTWSATAVNWLSTANEKGTFNEMIPTGFYNAAFRAEFVYNDNGGYEYGFGIDNFSIVNDCAYLSNIPEDASATTYAADREQTIGDWTHYINNAGTPELCDDILLLSVKKNGENIGTVGDGTFSCVLEVNPTASSISAPYVSNTDGWWTMNRYWNITPTTEPSSDVEVRFYYTEADFTTVAALSSAVTTHEDLYFWKINDVNPYDINPVNGHIGIPLASAHAQDGYQQYVNGTSSTTAWSRTMNYANNTDWNYSQYMVGHFGGGGGGGAAGTGALPVELISFDGKPLENCNIELSWKTATETDNSHFNLMRSSNNRDFEKISQIQGFGEGTTAEETSYSFVDKNPESRNYYRLDQVDLDGTRTSSSIIAVNNNCGGISIVSIYPNPIKSEKSMTIQIDANLENSATVQIVDVLGRKIDEFGINLNQGINSINYDTQVLSPGTFLMQVKMKDGSNSLFHKFVVLLN